MSENRRIQVYADSEDRYRWRKWTSSDITADSGQSYESKGGAIEAATREAEEGDVIEVLDDAGNAVNRYEVGEEAESE